jgi:GNAT superfamily N-acetyltransferase
MGRSFLQDGEREEVARFIEGHWHSRMVMSRGQCFYPHLEEGIVERREGQLVGLITFRRDDAGMEILTLDSDLEGQGIGSSLMLEAIAEARRRECRRVWFTTTNDNLRGMRFYQRLGFRFCAVNVGAVDAARRLKPQIPEVGQEGIPIHDEIVMELVIQPFLDSRMEDGAPCDERTPPPAGGQPPGSHMSDGQP